MFHSVVPGHGAPKKYALPEEWEQFRSLITRLYLGEDKSLSEVMSTLAINHNHHGTVKMYKSRIQKWGIDKNHKEEEMRAILHKKIQRDAVGKASKFSVREKMVSVEEVQKYFKRKGGLRPESVATSTDIILGVVKCWTPSPSPSPSLAPRAISWLLPRDVQVEDLFECPSQSSRVMDVDTVPSILDEDAVTGQNQIPYSMTVDQLWRRLCFSPGLSSFEIPRSLSPPQNLLIPEELLFYTKAYFDAAFSSGTFLLNDEGRLVHINGKLGTRKRLVDFSGFCITGVRFMSVGSYVEGRRMLSKAFALLKDVIQEQDPSVLIEILHMLFEFGNTRYPEIGVLLRSYISRLAPQILGKFHPFTQILVLLGAGEDSETQSMLRAVWRCTNDVFQQSLGRFQTNALETYLIYIACIIDPRSADKIFLNLLDEAGQKLDKSDLRVDHIRYSYASHLYGQKRYLEAITILYKIPIDARTHWVLEELAMCYLRTGQASKAEMALRAAIKSAEGIRGSTDPIVLSHKWRLSEWFRKWGRVEESDRLRAEVSARIEPDDIDQETLGV